MTRMCMHVLLHFTGCSDQHAFARETGQGLKGDEEELSSLEERLLKLMGVQSFEGVYFSIEYVHCIM